MVKAYKVINNLSGFYANIQLTGIYDIDYRGIKYYQESEYTKLRDSISKDIEDEKEYCHGYSFSSKIVVLNFLKELDLAISLTGDYPEIPTKIHDYEFKTDTVDEKYNEIKNYLQSNQFEGFNKEYFAVNGDAERRLWGLTFVKEDLKNAQKVRLKYQ